MRKGAILAFGLSAAFFLAMTATAQPPRGEKEKDKGAPGGRGGFGFGRGGPGQIMPTFLQERLKLSDDQKKAVADLQKEVETKMDKILTDEQRAELKKLREQGPGPGGFPGRGGFGGPGGKGGDRKAPEKKE